MRYASDNCPDPELAGYYGPDSVTWRLGSESFLLLGGGRAVLMQLAHPLVAAGVGQHSAYAADPWGRMLRTLDYTTKLTFGTRAEARAAAHAVNRMHGAVVGTLDTAAGAHPASAPYAAQRADLLLWVFATLVDTGLTLYPLLAGPLPRADQERYYQEARAAMALLGLRPDDAPATLAGFEAYMRDMLAGDTLAATEPARAVARAVMRMPAPFVLRPALDATGWITVALLPPRLRAMYGYTWDRPRQALFDAWAAGTRRLLPLLPTVVRHTPYARAAWRRVRPLAGVAAA